MIRLTEDQLTTCLNSDNPTTEYISELYYIRDKIYNSSMDKDTKFKANQILAKQLKEFRGMIRRMQVSQWGTNN